MVKNEISKDFRSVVTRLENNLKSVADGKNIIAGTKENPIVNDIFGINDLRIVGSIHSLQARHRCFFSRCGFKFKFITYNICCLISILNLSNLEIFSMTFLFLAGSS